MAERAESPASSGPQLYLGTSDGLHLLRGEMEHSHWRTVEHALAGHDISALGWDAAGRLLVGTADGQLFRRVSASAEWEPVGAGLPGRKIWSLVADPPAPAGSFYAGLGGGPLFHTPNAGR